MDPQELKKSGIVSTRQIPTLPFTLQNIAISFASVIAATASLSFTVSVMLPLATCRAILPTHMFRSAIPEGRNKVVLIVGASRGIGFNVMKQYAGESDTVVIAASRSMGQHHCVPITKVLIICPSRFASEGSHWTGQRFCQIRMCRT